MAYHILRADNLLTARSPLRSPEKYRATLKTSAFMIHEIFSNRARMVYTHHMTEYSPAKPGVYPIYRPSDIPQLNLGYIRYIAQVIFPNFQTLRPLR